MKTAAIGYSKNTMHIAVYGVEVPPGYTVLLVQETDGFSKRAFILRITYPTIGTWT